MSNVSVNELERGMVVDNDVFSKKGSLLLYKGFKIENPELVSIVLKRNGINYLIIKDEHTPTFDAVKESDRIAKKVKQEVSVFKEEFNKIVDSLHEDVEVFSKTKNVSQIKDIDKGSTLAKENEKSILTIFQLVEKIKNDGSDKYSDILQVSLISYSIGKWLDLDEVQLKELSEAAMLSGVFSLCNITYKNKDELKYGDDISKNIIYSALTTKERNDGSGPMGLTLNQIPQYSKIIAVAEVFYGLTTPNEFYERMSVFDALRVMQTEYLSILDTKIMYIFLHKVANKYIGSTVRLSDGTSGIIVFVPENEVALPFIKTGDGQVINLQNHKYKNNKIIEIL